MKAKKNIFPVAAVSPVTNAVPSPTPSAAPLFGENYPGIRKLSAAELTKAATWKAPANLSVNMASLHNILQVLAKKGHVSPLLAGTFTVELRKLEKCLDRVDPKTYAKIGTLAGRVFKDYKSTCMGSPDHQAAGQMVQEFLARNENDIGQTLQTLAVANLDQEWSGGRAG